MVRAGSAAQNSSKPDMPSCSATCTPKLSTQSTTTPQTGKSSRQRPVAKPDSCSSQPRLAADSRTELIAKLDGWNFEPQSLPSEHHVAECAVLIFEALFRIQGLQEAVGVSLDQIPPFIQHLRHIYRWQNLYHNFEHAVDALRPIRIGLPVGYRNTGCWVLKCDL
ncbi:hypothetical protein C8F01DRAFT_1236252 [Mycena amicta]|nr:hypothetical protein C8F01DRAFT_1236252 [Mycena amicta]